MSKIALNPNESGTGVFTLAAPDSNADRTLTLPDEAGTVATIENIPPGYEDQDALDLFNVTGSAPVFACRAWVNFDGITGPTIRASGNVSSVVRNATGNYTVNFTTAMPDTNYALGGTAGDIDTAANGNLEPLNFTTNNCNFGARNQASNDRSDRNLISAVIFR